jgi:hypothetical protein
MAQPEFSVHLGGGLYMDSNGVLSHGADPGKPIYPTPGGGLPVDPAAVAKAFQGIAKALPDKDDPKSREKFDKALDGIGMAPADKENLIGVLQAVGAVASVIGSVVPIVGAALAVLTLLIGLFKSGPSPLEVLITRRFDDLERKIKALETQIQQRDLRDQRNAIAGALAAIANYVEELKHTPPDPAALLQRQQDVRAEIGQAGLAVRNLLDSTTWLATFDRNEHKNVWPWISHRLFTFPTAGGPQQALMPPQGANQFDHRLMVPLTLYAVTAYLTLLRAAAPEFRSTRQNREDLWDFADALEILAENMRREGLSRTVYVGANFNGGPTGIPWGISPAEVIDLSAVGVDPVLAPGNTRFAVGALDLRDHNDVHFTPTFSASAIQSPGAENAQQGLMDVRWMPPAKLEGYDEPVTTLGWEPPNQPARTQRRYRITNPNECAEAANVIADQNYVDLLYSSGYFNLIHLVATLRNESTDPDRSQTVRTEAWLRRKAGASVNVTVESPPILLTGVIKAAAQRQVQDYKATTWFTTQPLGRERKLNYRVWLRTLPANFSSTTGTWRSEQAYADFHRVGYTIDPARPKFSKLETSTASALDGLKIAEGTSSPDVMEASGTAMLKAVTFDWWIPVKPIGPAGLFTDRLPLDAALRATGFELAGSGTGGTTAPAGGTAGGGSGPQPPALPTSSVAEFSALAETQLSDYVGWTDDEEPVSGQRRMVKESDVHIGYTLRWQADRLTVTLQNNRPQDRNYIVHVVVEETLGSGEVLHTEQRVPVTGQLTFVPQSFFDEEREALERVAKLFRDFEEKYAESLRDIPGPRPGDPDPWPWREGLLGLDRELFAADPVLRLFQIASFNAPEDFGMVAALALRHPPAARVLRGVMNEAQLSEADLVAMLDSASVDVA